MNEIRTFAPLVSEAATVLAVRRGLALCVSMLLVLTAVSTALGAEPKPAPRTVGKTLAGKRLALSDLRGKPVVINVWSSW